MKGENKHTKRVKKAATVMLCYGFDGISFKLCFLIWKCTMGNDIFIYLSVSMKLMKF